MTNERTQPEKSRRLPATVWLLSWVSLLADISGEMMYPLLPLFLVSVLGASKVQIGAIEGLALLMVALMSAYSGWRSDRSGMLGPRRVPWIRWGYGLPVLGKGLIALASIWPMVLAGRLLDRLGKGLRGAPRDALLADAVDETQRGQAFGLHRALDTIGALLGVLLAALLFWWWSGSPGGAVGLPVDNAASPTVDAWAYRAVFATAALLGLGSWLLTFVIREPQGLKAELPDDSTAPIGLAEETGSLTARKANLWSSLSPKYWSTLVILGLFSLANSSDTFLLLRASELGFSPWEVVLAYALFNAMYALGSYPAGNLSDRWGRWSMITLGWVIYIAVYFTFAFLERASAWWVWPLMGTYGLYMALTEGVGKALIADCAPPELRGRAMGLFHATSGVATLLASLLVGFLWEYQGPVLALVSSGLVASGALGLILFWRDRLQ
jgi:MFS family permease